MKDARLPYKVTEYYAGLSNLQDPLTPDKAAPLNRKDSLLFSSHDTLPHIASSGTWTSGFFTIFQVVNHSATQAHPFTVRFYDDSGEPLTMKVFSRAAETSTVDAVGFAGTLGPGQYGSQAAAPSGPSRIGYAVIETSGPVALSGMFMQSVPGRPLFMTYMPSEPGYHDRVLVPFMNSDGMTFSMALVNSSSFSSQSITLTARNGSGGTCQATFALPPAGHRAFLLRDYLPCAREGSLEVVSSGFFSGVGIVAQDGGAFVTVPIFESSAP